jgi:hypothetical protein
VCADARGVKVVTVSGLNLQNKMKYLSMIKTYSDFLLKLGKHSHREYIFYFDLFTHNHRRNLGGGQDGTPPTPNIFSNLGIVFLVTKMNNGK